MSPQKGMLEWLFEFDGPDDTDVEVRIYYTYQRGIAANVSGPADNWYPAEPHEVEYEYAERQTRDPKQDGKLIWHRLKTNEFLDEQCQAYLASRDEDDLTEGLPDGGEPDPDRQREDREERRQMERE